MEVSQIVSLSTLGVFLIFLTVGFLIGLARGLKKSSLRLGVFAITTLIAFLITPLFSKIALNLDLGFIGMEGSISDIIQTQIDAQPEVSSFVASSLTMQNFVEQASYIVLNLLTFVIVFIAINLVGGIVYLILKSVIFRKKKTKEWRDGNAYKVALEDKKPGKKRLLGGLVSAVQSIMFMAILLLPITGFVKLAYDTSFQSDNQAYASTQYSPTSKLLQENLPSEVLDGIKAYRKSAIGISSTVIGTDSFMFDALTKAKVQTEGEKITFAIRPEVKSFAKIYNNLEFLTEIDFEEVVYKDLDYNKIENAVDLVFDSKLLKTLAPEFLNWALEDINKPEAEQVLQLSLGDDELQIINKITDEYEKVFGTVYKGLKNDLDTVVQVAVGTAKSGLLDEALSQTIDLDKIESILQANNKEFINKTLSDLFKAISLRVVAVEGINYLLEDFSNADVTFSLVSYNKVNWEGVVSDVTSIANNVLDMLVSVSDEFSGGIQGVIEENPFELLEADTTLLSNKLGIIMTTLQNTSLLVDENGDKVVYNQFMDYLNKTEISEYINFTPFKQQNAWKGEMENLNNIILAIKKSGVLSEIINNIDDLSVIDYNFILGKISDIDNENSKTYTYNIINSIFNSKVFEKGINIAFDMLNELIEENQEMLGDGTNLGKVQGNRLNSEQEKAYMLSFFDNFVLYASELELDGDESSFASSILASDLSRLGLALDAIKNSTIFGSYEENGNNYDGVYISLIHELNNNEQLSNFADFTIVLDESFDGWNIELARVQSIVESMENIEINEKTLLQAILDGEETSSLIDNLTSEDIDRLLDPIIESQLLSKNVTMFVDTINQMVADFTEKTIDDVTSQNVISQKQAVKNVLKKALNLTEILTEEFSEEILKENAVVLGEFLNLLKQNKLDNGTDAVFGQTYDALVDYMKQNEEFGATISDLIDEYENPDDIDWEDLFDLFVQMDQQDITSGFTPEFKTLFASIFATMKEDIDYQEITISVIDFMEKFTDFDTIETLADFVSQYTSALNILAVKQNEFESEVELGEEEEKYEEKVEVVLEFFNKFIPADTFEILDLTQINDYSEEIASANALQSAKNNFDELDFSDTTIQQELNDTVDELLSALAESQLLFDLLEDSSVDFEVSDFHAKVVLEDRIHTNYSGEEETRLKAFFGI